MSTLQYLTSGTKNLICKCPAAAVKAAKQQQQVVPAILKYKEQEPLEEKAGMCVCVRERARKREGRRCVCVVGIH